MHHGFSLNSKSNHTNNTKYDSSVLPQLMNKLPPVEIMCCIISTTKNIPALKMFRHIDVHADSKNESPVNEEWINAYFVNCFISFSTIHARMLRIYIHIFKNIFEFESIYFCFAEINHKTVFRILARVTRRDPIEIVPIPIIALNTPRINELDGPFRSRLPSCE